MKKHLYGDSEASNVLIQLIDGHDLSGMENEVTYIKEHFGDDFFLMAIEVNDWDHNLSPWKAPAVFGNRDFGNGAAETLKEALKEVRDDGRHYYIGGYSLAGLFALWAVYQSDVFDGTAAASPSVWFPGFLEHAKDNDIMTRKVYLSLGDREEKTRNPVMAEVGDCIRIIHAQLDEKGIRNTLEWNEGNHFKDPDIRTARAFVWLLDNNL